MARDVEVPSDKVHLQITKVETIPKKLTTRTEFFRGCPLMSVTLWSFSLNPKMQGFC